jgi:hypothetical protein
MLNSIKIRVQNFKKVMDIKTALKLGPALARCRKAHKGTGKVCKKMKRPLNSNINHRIRKGKS